MTALLIGLVLFLGVHSTRLVADGARTRFIAQHGEKIWKGLYTLASVVGLLLIVWGYALARPEPVALWSPPGWTRPLASALMLVSFVLLTAAFVPRNGIRAAVGHPMVLGVKVWAFAHLASNHTLADLLLFGGFLLWALLCYRSLRARDRAAGRNPPPGRASATVTAVVVGVLLWAGVGFWLHGWLFGVSPFV